MSTSKQVPRGTGVEGEAKVEHGYYPGTSYRRIPLTAEDLAIVSRSAAATMFHLAAVENDCDSFADMWERGWHLANNDAAHRRTPADWWVRLAGDDEEDENLVDDDLGTQSDEPDYGGPDDGNSIYSDADPGL